MCMRYCGHCPVMCYQCHEIDDPTNCTNLVLCPTMDHYCFTIQSFKDDLTEVYQMGCAVKATCQQHFGPEHKKKNIDINGACCMEDKCNNRLPLNIMTSANLPTRAPAGNQINITTDNYLCENFDDTACMQFASSKPDVCSDECFATNVCPRMCGKCFNCYTCNDIETVKDCNVTNVCHAGHECFSLQTLSYDLKPVYRVGCMEEQLCTRFQVNSGTIFGRRNTFSLVGGCCKGDLCNNRLDLNQPTTTMTPTTASKCQHPHGQCPAGYASAGNSCYMIGPHRMSWTAAKQYCEDHCAHLVDFSSTQEMIAVFTLVVPHHNGIFQDERVWTDAQYVSNHWIWESSGTAVNVHDFTHLSSNQRSHCGVAIVHTVNSGLQTGIQESVIPADCGVQYFPLCETTRM